MVIFVYSNGTSGGKQQAITSKALQQQHLVNGNSAIELYSPKNNSGLSDGLLLPGACDLCDGNYLFMYLCAYYKSVVSNSRPQATCGPLQIF